MWDEDEDITMDEAFARIGVRARLAQAAAGRRGKGPRDLFEPVPPMVATWITAEGEEIPIDELEDSHLMNVLSFLMRRAPNRMAAQRAVLAASHGEVEATSIDNTTVVQWLEENCYHWKPLVAEAARRNLGRGPRREQLPGWASSGE